jgi:DNA-binding winged helix-turn-helix (wHTH) protein/TolB-like protein
MPRIYSFGLFEFDADLLQLTRDGRPVRLQRQPAQALAILLERAGSLVTREELRRAVWGDHTFVDFERGLNFCIGQIRSALADDADAPRYIRTSPKKGYELICPVRTVGDPRQPTVQSSPPEPGARGLGHRVPALAAALAVTMTAAAAVVSYYHYAVSGRSAQVIVAVARFDNETGDPELTRFSDSLTDSIVEQLTLRGAGQFEVIGNSAILRRSREQRDLRAIATSLHASFVVLGQVQRDSQHVRVLGHLIRLPEETHVSVSRFDDVADRTLAGTADIASRIARKFAGLLTQSNKSLSVRDFRPFLFLVPGMANLAS